MILEILSLSRLQKILKLGGSLSRKRKPAVWLDNLLLLPLNRSEYSVSQSSLKVGCVNHESLQPCWLKPKVEMKLFLKICIAALV